MPLKIENNIISSTLGNYISWAVAANKGQRRLWLVPLAHDGRTFGGGVVGGVIVGCGV